RPTQRRHLTAHLVPATNGVRLDAHCREEKRRQPHPGDRRAIYAAHPDRVPLTAGPGSPIVRRDLAVTPDRGREPAISASARALLIVAGLAGIGIAREITRTR